MTRTLDSDAPTALACEASHILCVSANETDVSVQQVHTDDIHSSATRDRNTLSQVEIQADYLLTITAIPPWCNRIFRHC